jgi:hypothetical protein
MQTDLEPIKAALCERLRGDWTISPDVIWDAAATIEALAARLAKAEAERDAAVAENESLKTWMPSDNHMVAEGERRERERIVADLRNTCSGTSDEYAARIIGRRDLYLADRYERGDHLQG